MQRKTLSPEGFQVPLNGLGLVKGSWGQPPGILLPRAASLQKPAAPEPLPTQQTQLREVRGELTTMTVSEHVARVSLLRCHLCRSKWLPPRARSPSASRARGSGRFCHRAHFTDREAEAQRQQRSQQRGALGEDLGPLMRSGPGREHRAFLWSCSQPVLLPPRLSGHGAIGGDHTVPCKDLVTKRACLSRDTEIFTGRSFSWALNKHKSSQ